MEPCPGVFRTRVLKYRAEGSGRAIDGRNQKKYCKNKHLAMVATPPPPPRGAGWKNAESQSF